MVCQKGKIRCWAGFCFLLIIAGFDSLAEMRWSVICPQIPEQFVRLILLDRFWVVYLLVSSYSLEFRTGESAPDEV